MIGKLQRQFIAAFQEDNPEKFNEDLIFMRNKESKELHHYFYDVFNSLKLKGITFLSSETITDETEFHKYIPKKSIPIENSRLELVRAKFRLEADGESKEIVVQIFFPKLIDNYFYEIKGSRYLAVYQVTDRNFYTSSDASVYLKSLLMPLGLYLNSKGNTPIEIVDENEEIVTLPNKEFVLDFFKLKKKSTHKNAFYYYFIKYEGVQNAIDIIFGNTDDHKFVFITEERENYEGYCRIEIRKDLYIYCWNNFTNTYKHLVSTLYHALKGIRKSSVIDSVDYWKRKILNNATAKLEKADRTMISLERILDNRTKKNLSREIVNPELREDSYGVVRWMMYNFDNSDRSDFPDASLVNIDPVNIYNRRIRLTEYMIYPLLTKLSDSSYRILNSRNINIKRLENVFSTIGPNYILKFLSGNELLRYYNATSSLDLFSTLKWSARGNQGLGKSSSTVATKFRGLHPSYLGVISLNAASASDPGLTGTFCPLSNNFGDMEFIDHSNEIHYINDVLDIYTEEN